MNLWPDNDTPSWGGNFYGPSSNSHANLSRKLSTQQPYAGGTWNRPSWQNQNYGAGKGGLTWGGQGYNLGQNLYSASRGAKWDYDPMPSSSAPMLPSAEWGDRELDRQATGFYSAAYDPYYSPYVETSYSPFYDPFGASKAQLQEDQYSASGYSDPGYY